MKQTLIKYNNVVSNSKLLLNTWFRDEKQIALTTQYNTFLKQFIYLAHQEEKSKTVFDVDCISAFFKEKEIDLDVITIKTINKINQNHLHMLDRLSMLASDLNIKDAVLFDVFLFALRNRNINVNSLKNFKKKDLIFQFKKYLANAQFRNTVDQLIESCKDMPQIEVNSVDEDLKTKVDVRFFHVIMFLRSIKIASIFFQNKKLVKPHIKTISLILNCKPFDYWI